MYSRKKNYEFMTVKRRITNYGLIFKTLD